MNNSDTAHCRLCADLKPKAKMINLQEDDEKKNEIVNKLSRLNTNVDICGNTLPETVCFVCINSLDKAFEFVTGVEQAQSVLNGIILVQIKKEDSISDTETNTYDFHDDVKIDAINIKLELEEENSIFKDNHMETHDNNCIVKSEARSPKEEVEDLDIASDQLELTWRDYSWICVNCASKFQAVDKLKVHAMQYHNCCNVFKCTDCNTIILNLDSFIAHVKMHRKILKLSCSSCYSTFSTPQEVNFHESLHVSSEYSCQGCNSTFTSLDEMSSHVFTYYRDKHMEEIPMLTRLTGNLTCVLCKKVFKSKPSLNKHLLIHTERKREYECDECGKSFFSKYRLIEHISLHNMKRTFKCKKCKATFKTIKNLRSHIKIHNAQKPFECDQCRKSFRLQRHLAAHMIIHTGLLPYICTYCNKGFRFNSVLKQHMLVHTGEKPYSCEVCNRGFTSWSNCNSHTKRKHGIDMSKKKHLR